MPIKEIFIPLNTLKERKQRSIKRNNLNLLIDALELSLFENNLCLILRNNRFNKLHLKSKME